MLSLLKTKDSARACLYSSWAKDFVRERELLRYSLTDIQDEGTIYNPFGYRLAQAIIQDSGAFNRGNPRYYVDEAIFNHLNNLERSALIIHELVYREGRLINPEHFKNAMGVRFFNAFLFSQQLLQVTDKNYKTYCQALGLPTTEDYCDPNHPIYKK